MVVARDRLRYEDGVMMLELWSSGVKTTNSKHYLKTGLVLGPHDCWRGAIGEAACCRACRRLPPASRRLGTDRVGIYVQRGNLVIQGSLSRQRRGRPASSSIIFLFLSEDLIGHMWGQILVMTN